MNESVDLRLLGSARTRAEYRTSPRPVAR